MVDGINNAHGITPQSGKTVKKQEQTAHKDSASIFNNKGNEKIDLDGMREATTIGAVTNMMNYVVEKWSEFTGESAGETAVKPSGQLEADAVSEGEVDYQYSNEYKLPCGYEKTKE